jgi:hypothetical protein
MDWQRFREQANSDRLLARFGAGSSFAVLLRWNADEYLIRFRDGKIDAVQTGPFVMPQCDFALAGSAEVWRRFTQPHPAPRDQDLFAFFRRGELVLTGDARKFFAHLLCLKIALEKLRTAG